MKKIFKWTLIGFFAFVFTPYAVGLNIYAYHTRQEAADIVRVENERLAYDHWNAAHKGGMKGFSEQVKQKAPDYGLGIIIHPSDKFLDGEKL